MKVFLFVFLFFFSFSCVKKIEQEERQLNETTRISKARKVKTDNQKKKDSTNSKSYCPDCPIENPFPENEYNDVTGDQNFIHMINIDEQLENLMDTSMVDWTDQQYQTLLNNINVAQTNAQLLALFTQAGYANANQIVSLLQQKVNATMLLVQNNSRFSGMTIEELKATLTGAYSEYLYNNRGNVITYLDGCAQGYADAVSDCDDDFKIVSTVAILEGIGFSIFTTPVGGAIAASTTIGIGYAQHTRCMKSAVRSWKRCRGI